MGMQSQATLTIRVDLSAEVGVTVTVVGEGRAKEIADRLMKAVVDTQPEGNFLGCEDFSIQ
jgi:hypothetical protein